jgi:hypothetical protein
MLRIPRPCRERITADMRLQPSASAQILATLGLLISARRYLKSGKRGKENDNRKGQRYNFTVPFRDALPFLQRAGRRICWSRYVKWDAGDRLEVNQKGQSCLSIS